MRIVDQLPVQLNVDLPFSMKKDAFFGDFLKAAERLGRESGRVDQRIAESAQKAAGRVNLFRWDQKINVPRLLQADIRMQERGQCRPLEKDGLQPRRVEGRLKGQAFARKDKAAPGSVVGHFGEPVSRRPGENHSGLSKGVPDLGRHPMARH